MKTISTAARAPRALPLLGHILPLLRNPLQFLTSLHACGDLVEIRIGPFTAIVVNDPDLIRQVLLDDRTFDKGGFLFDQGRELLGNGLVTCPHSEHRRQRRLVQPAFHPARLTGYAQVMTDQAAAVTGSWQDGQTLDVLAEMSTITARIAVATMFATTLRSSLLSETLDDFNVISAGMYKRMLMPPPLDTIPTVGNRHYDGARARLRQTISTIITDHRSGGIDRGDLLSTLLITPEADESGLSDTEITDQIITFFSAGIETSANVVAWAAHLLAHHPEIEQRLHTEVDTVMAGTAATLDDLPQLQLTGNIITETLRLYPPIWLLTRITTTDTRLGRHAIPAGTTLVYSPYLLHRRPDLYPDPERFDPDRWNDQHTSQPPRNAFLPFGAGARKCVGNTFSLTEATLALATIAARWRLEPLPGPPVRPALGVTLRPRGLRMRATARTRNY